MDALHRKIRYAEEADNPLLFSHFLSTHFNVELDNTGTHEQCIVTKTEQRSCLLAQFELLLVTLSDQSIPMHWRLQCLDHINKPLFTLQRLVDDENSAEQVRDLFTELKMINQSLLHRL
ncbi:hypothetical protein [Psychromonas sp. L1A2]|uniref:hypothetical protein n=1 Tax=Psychromonas sp. L1A2 TaxID=2686356 RepID=UPI00135BD4D7|nr:hypothetical protein [Psychromonas sp. L1A2]